MEPKTGIELIAEERREQIEKHGRTIQTDLEVNKGGALSMAAKGVITGDWGEFPAEWDSDAIRKMCGKPYKDRLIIAGALLAAEIDRLQAGGDLPEEEVGNG